MGHFSRLSLWGTSTPTWPRWPSATIPRDWLKDTTPCPMERKFSISQIRSLLMSVCLLSSIPVPSTLAPTSCTRPLVCGRTKSASKDLLVSHPRVRQLQQRRQSLAKKDSLTRLRVRVAIKKDRTTPMNSCSCTYWRKMKLGKPTKTMHYSNTIDSNSDFPSNSKLRLYMKSRRIFHSEIDRVLYVDLDKI